MICALNYIPMLVRATESDLGEEPSDRPLPWGDEGPAGRTFKAARDQLHSLIQESDDLRVQKDT